MSNIESIENDRLQVVVFTVGDEEYAVPVARVESIIAAAEPTEVPGAGRHIRGVFNLRGKVISIIDLRSRLDLPPREDGEGRVLVVSSGDHTVGIEVDSVSEVFSLDPNDVQPTPAQLAESSIVSGILRLDDRLVIIVEIDPLVALDSLAEAG